MRLNFFLPALFLLLIVALNSLANRWLGDQTFAPFLAVISIFILAGFLPARWILLWLPLFAATSYYLIMESSQFPKTRIVTVILAGLMGAWASYFREKASQQAQEIEMVLRNLPTPWALISRDGAILKANPQGAALLGSTPEDIVGHSVFEFSSNGKERRLLIDEFVRVDQGLKADSGLDFPLGQIQATGKNVASRIFLIPSLRDKPLLMVLQEA